MPGGGVKKPHYIQFNINEYSHRHTIKAKRVNTDNPFRDYGTDLVAAPFWDPLPNTTDDNNLNPFTPSYPDAQAIDIAAAGLADPGVIADIDRYRILWSEKEELQKREHDLRMAWDQWRDKNHSVQHHLQAVRTRSRLHPYLWGQAYTPHIRNNIDTAVSSGIPIADVLHGQVADPPYCLPMPWLHDEERPGVSCWVMSMGRQSHVSERPEVQRLSPPTRIKCTKCQLPDANHITKHCPLWRVCHYCGLVGHQGFNCWFPHTGCQNTVGCVVPRTHKNYAVDADCPWHQTPNHTHQCKYKEEWTSGEWDANFDDDGIDLEVEDRG